MGKEKNDIPSIAEKLLAEIDNECPGENKYEIALRVLTNQSKLNYNDPNNHNDTKRIDSIRKEISKNLKIQPVKSAMTKEEKAAEAAKKAAEEKAAEEKAAEEKAAEAAKKEARRITGTREERLKAYKEAEKEAADAAAKKKWRISSLFRVPRLGGNKTKKSKKGMSLCVKKTAKKCAKVRGCKMASGSKRTYCRKKKNHTQKSHKK